MLYTSYVTLEPQVGRYISMEAILNLNQIRKSDIYIYIYENCIISRTVHMDLNQISAYQLVLVTEFNEYQMIIASCVTLKPQIG